MTTKTTFMSETEKLWKVRRNVFRMCHDRMYLVLQEELDTTLEQFEEQFGGHPADQIRRALTILVARVDDPSDQMFVFFDGNLSIGIQHVKVFCRKMDEEKVKRSILVGRGKLTNQCIKLLNEMSSRYLLEFFHEGDLLFNPTDHSYVPQHIVLTPEEKRMLLDRYKLKESQLPRILTTDPIARYYGMTKGQVFKIVSASKTAGKYVSYRITV